MIHFTKQNLYNDRDISIHILHENENPVTNFKEKHQTYMLQLPHMHICYRGRPLPQMTLFSSRHLTECQIYITNKRESVLLQSI